MVGMNKVVPFKLFFGLYKPFYPVPFKRGGYFQCFGKSIGSIRIASASKRFVSAEIAADKESKEFWLARLFGQFGGSHESNELHTQVTLSLHVRRQGF